MIKKIVLLFIVTTTFQFCNGGCGSDAAKEAADKTSEMGVEINEENAVKEAKKLLKKIGDL